MRPGMKKHNPEMMGKESIGKLLFKFSLPATIAMLVHAIYNVVDRAFIGQVAGKLAFNGVYISFPIMMGVMGIGFLIGIGGSALFSIKLGEGDKKGAMRLLGNSAFLLFAASIMITSLGIIFAEPLLKLFGATPDNMPFALTYLRIIFGGNIFMMVGMGLNNFLRAEGRATIAMATMIIGAVANMILDYIFIVLLGWGVSGAAWATVIARGIGASWVMYYYLSGRTSIPLKVSMMKLKWSVVKPILSLGSSAFFQQIAMSAMMGILNSTIRGLGGDSAIAVMGTIFSIMVLVHLPIMGIAQGAQPIFGFNFGAKKYARLKKSLIISGLAALGFAMIGFTAVQLFPGVLSRIFMSNKDAVEVIKTAERAMPIFLMMLPLAALQVIGAGYFRSVGKAWHALGLGLLRQFIIFVPLVLILPRMYGLDGVWIIGPISDTAAFLVTAVFLVFEIKKLNRDGQQASEEAPIVRV
jgi:MATE family, multidrug efflux pump